MKTQALIALLAATCLITNAAHAASATFDVSFTATSYAVDSDDTFSDLLAQHLLGTPISSTSVVAVDNIDTSLYAGNISGDYSVMMSTTLNIGVAGDYTFQLGTDWGRGGGVALIDTDTNMIMDELVTDDDIWWGYNWNHPDVIETTYTLAEGLYTISWIGFEGCCAGSSTVRFAYENNAFSTLDLTNIAPYVVPIPAPVYLFGTGLLALVGVRRRAETAGDDGVRA